MKKCEQMRRVCDTEVAIFVLDKPARQLYTYQSTIDDRWPPSKEQMVRSSLTLLPPSLIPQKETDYQNIEDLFPSDFETVREDHGSKSLRENPPDIRLRNVPQRTRFSHDRKPKTRKRHRRQISGLPHFVKLGSPSPPIPSDFIKSLALRHQEEIACGQSHSPLSFGLRAFSPI